jgi:chromosome segregation ATPase
MAEQLDGPLVSTVKNVVNEELLSNNAYALALKENFTVFNHSKFALIPAAWKTEIESQIEQTNERMDQINDRLAEQERRIAASAICVHDSLSDFSYRKGLLKMHDASITSLQAEITTQNATVTNLASNLEAALAKIASLELQLKKPRIIEYSRNIDDKISELTSIVDDKLKPVFLQQ